MPKIATMPAYRDRAPKMVPSARCCWVCGRLGGDGFTHLLRGAGYRMKLGEMAYAHPKCASRATAEAEDRIRANLRSPAL